MKVHCPSCHNVVPVENVALETGWGKCTGCREDFPLHEVLDGFRIPTFGPVDSFPERPFDAWIIVDHPDEQSMAVLVPARGMRPTSWFMLIFASVWTGFLACWA